MAKRWKMFLFEHLVLVEETRPYQGVRDPKDDKFVACALSAGASILVSGDDDLLTLRQLVITQRQQAFLDELEGSIREADRIHRGEQQPARRCHLAKSGLNQDCRLAVIVAKSSGVQNVPTTATP